MHKDADTMLLFTRPSIINTFESGSVELPAGKVRACIDFWAVEIIPILTLTIHGNYSYITIHPN